MIWEQVKLKLDVRQLKKLKGHNARIIEYLEDHLPLKLSILSDLINELTYIVNNTPQLVKILQKVHDSGDYYVVQLLHDDNEILNLPWSIAVDNISGNQLGGIQRLLLSKCLPAYSKRTPKTTIHEVAPPLKILIMISSPEDSKHKDRLSYEDEEFRILTAFEPLFQTGQVQVDYTDDGSLEALRRKIIKNKYHIVHYSGHAAYQEGNGYVILENPLNLNTEIVSARDFAEALNCNPDYRIPLVVLSSCQSAKGSTEEGLRGVTNHLQRVGIPAVISMGMAIDDRYAADFSAELYKNIANKHNILISFNSAVQHLKELEYLDRTKAGDTSPVPLQWIIPNLYLASELEHLVNWDIPYEDLKHTSYRLIYKHSHLLLEPERDFLFIGRRKDKAKIMEPFFKREPILLKGQGGVGKTAMAEHLVQRLIAHDPHTEPFLFGHKKFSIDEVQKQLENFLASIDKLNITELNYHDKGMKQISYLAFKVAEECLPVFIFDNLETFQEEPGEKFAPGYQDLKEIISFFTKSLKFHVVLTSRYPLPYFPEAMVFDLNQVSINDFWKKCHYMDIKRVREQLLKQKIHRQLKGILDRDEIEFFDVVKLLHETFGGNYRALQFFDDLFRVDPNRLDEALGSLETFQEKYAGETAEVKMKMSQNLLFDDLMKLLKPGEKEILNLLSHFRIPVLEFALQLQREHGENWGDLHAKLETLTDLTLLERSWDLELGKVYYYCTPIVKDLLEASGQKVPAVPFNPEKAGIYHLYCCNNLGLLVTEMEEAFFHFYQSKVKNRVQFIGKKISDYYYDSSLFKNSLYYGELVYKMLGEDTEGFILNQLGLVYTIFGIYYKALEFYKKALDYFIKVVDKQSEGTILTNMGEFYLTRGEYDTALSYLNRSLQIRQEVGDRPGEGLTLNNIAGIYHARGECDTALSYFKRSLQIIQEMGDKAGEGASLNNIGEIHRKRGDIVTALSYLNRSLQIIQEMGDKAREGPILNNMGEIYLARGEYDTALSYLERSLQIKQEIGNKRGMIPTLHNIALIAYDKKDYRTFLNYESQAYKIAMEINHAEGLFQVGMYYGLALYRRGKKEEGLEILKRSYNIGKATKFPQTEELEKVLKELGEL